MKIKLTTKCRNGEEGNEEMEEVKEMFKKLKKKPRKQNEIKWCTGEIRKTWKKNSIETSNIMVQEI